MKKLIDTEKLRSEYGAEPFDLRLCLLRMVRHMPLLVGLIFLGTLLIGGGYYLCNVVFAKDLGYSATATYKVTYVTPPTASGDYYINYATWNTYVTSAEFLDLLLAQDEMTGVSLSAEEVAQTLSVAVASDVMMPSVTVTGDDLAVVAAISNGVQALLTDVYLPYLPEVSEIRCIDPGVASAVEADVRPVRAALLGLVLSAFFVIVLYLLKECTDDAIYLPKTLRRRYGLHCAGSISAKGFTENLRYACEGRGGIVVCAQEETPLLATLGAQLRTNTMYREVIAPMGDLVQTKALREADCVVLLVEAGPHAGKKLELLLEYFLEQNIAVTTTVLYNADDLLIKWYYHLGEKEA